MENVIFLLGGYIFHNNKKKIEVKRKEGGDTGEREVPFICNDGHKSLNGRDQNATRVYHTHALTKCSNACQSNKISSKRGSLSQGQLLR